MRQQLETFVAVDPGLDYVAASYWNVTGWRGDSRLELCARRFLGVRTVRTSSRDPLPERLLKLQRWMNRLVETEPDEWQQPDVVAIELPPIATAYRRNRYAQRSKTDPGAANRAPFYMALGALVAGCGELPRVVLVPPPPGRKKARFEGDLDRRAIVERLLPHALTRGKNNQDVVDSIAIGLDCLTRWPLPP